MGLPTLLRKGSLVAPTGDDNEQKSLNNIVPIEHFISWFRERQAKTGVENRVLILKSETASGKSTCCPPELYKAFVMGEVNSPGIICTQPRVMTAIENVNEMLKHYNKELRLGKTVGWSTKHNKFAPRDPGLLSATIGTLTQQLRTLTDEEISALYRFILIDETHERDLQTDLTICMLKNLLLRNADNVNCPFVVLMSATFDPTSFIEYFDIDLAKNFIWCRGEAAGFEERWDWNSGRTVNNYCQAAASVVERIVRENPNDDPKEADILIFMPGAAEFNETRKYLDDLNKQLAEEGAYVFSPLQVDSGAVQRQNRDYKWTLSVPVSNHLVNINGKEYTPRRRVIISTNVAETGLTLDNLKYVIDGGYNREIEYNPVYGVRALVSKPAPKSRIRQRRGRAGRKFPGVFYPLYPQYIYDDLPELQLPQILIEDVSSIMLDVITEQLKMQILAHEDPVFNANAIDMIDVPTPDALAAAVEKLYALGLVSPISPKWDLNRDDFMNSNPRANFSITRLGLLVTMLNLLTPEAARMVFGAFYWGASVLDMATIAAYITMEGRSFTTGERANDGMPIPIEWVRVYRDGAPSQLDGAKVKLLTTDDFIDGLFLFSAVKRVVSGKEPWSAAQDLISWCTVANVSYRAVMDLIRARDEIVESMLTEGLDVFVNEENSLSKSDAANFMSTITRIKYCIYDGYRTNLLLLDDENTYRTQTGLAVLKPKFFSTASGKEWIESAEKNAMPKHLVCSGLSLKYNRVTYAYDVKANTVSVCDGFVNVDTTFLQTRVSL